MSLIIMGRLEGRVASTYLRVLKLLSGELEITAKQNKHTAIATGGLAIYGGSVVSGDLCTSAPALLGSSARSCTRLNPSD